VVWFDGRMRISAVVGMWLDRPPEEALHAAALADRLGFGELWIGDNGSWDTFALATAIGLATDRIAITAGPLAVTVRDPATIAIGAASVAALTGRHVGVALGTSNAAAVEDRHGRSYAGSVAALEDAARKVPRLLVGERTGGYRLRLDTPETALTVAALGDRAIAVAAAHAERMVASMVTPEQAAELRRRLSAAARSAGRKAPRLAVWLPAALDPRPEAYAQIIWHLVDYLARPGHGDLLAEAGFAEAVAKAREGTASRDLLAAMPFEAVGRIGLTGDAAAVRSRLQEYADAGVDEIAVVPATGADPGGERTLTAIREVAEDAGFAIGRYRRRRGR
jgi:probable F420-dependent oxidoreductase